MINRLVHRTNKMSESIENEFVEYLAKPRELFEKLQSLSREYSGKNFSSKKGIEKAKQVIIELNKNHKADICFLATEAINAGFAKYSTHYVEDTIPFLTHNMHSLVSYLRMVMSPNSQTIKSLAFEQPEFTSNLLVKLIEIGEEFCTDLIVTIILELEDRDIADKHRQLLELANNTKLPVVKAAILTIGNLQYDVKMNKTLLKQTIEQLESFIVLDAQNTDEIRQTAIWALCKLLYIGHDIKSKVLILAKQQDPVTSPTIIQFIFNHRQYIDNSEWFESLLMSFVDFPYIDKEILSTLDFGLQILFLNTKWRPLAENFLTTLLSFNHEYINKSNIEDIFGSTLSTVSA